MAHVHEYEKHNRDPSRFEGDFNTHVWCLTRWSRQPDTEQGERESRWPLASNSLLLNSLSARTDPHTHKLTLIITCAERAFSDLNKPALGFLCTLCSQLLFVFMLRLKKSELCSCFNKKRRSSWQIPASRCAHCTYTHTHSTMAHGVPRLKSFISAVDESGEDCWLCFWPEVWAGWRVSRVTLHEKSCRTSCIKRKREVALLLLLTGE